jgi:hypothetical protein
VRRLLFFRDNDPLKNQSRDIWIPNGLVVPTVAPDVLVDLIEFWVSSAIDGHETIIQNL